MFGIKGLRARVAYLEKTLTQAELRRETENSALTSRITTISRDLDTLVAHLGLQFQDEVSLCEECGGKGHVSRPYYWPPIMTTCSTCSGKGMTRKRVLVAAVSSGELYPIPDCPEDTGIDDKNTCLDCEMWDKDAGECVATCSSFVERKTEEATK